MSDKVSDCIYKLALDDKVVSKGMVKLLDDYGFEVDEDKALKLFYSVIAHLMYHLDIHPGQYFKLKYIDITNDKDNFIVVKRNSDYTEDTVNPQMFYGKFCGSTVLKEELESTLDLFAKSFLGIREDKRRERVNIDNLLYKRKKLSEEIQECDEIARNMKKQKKALYKLRKEEGKKIKAYARKEGKWFTSNVEYHHRDKEQASYAKLEEKLRELWEEKISLKEILDKVL